MGEVIIPVNGLKLNGTNNWFPLKEKPKTKKKMGVKGEILLQFAIPAPKGKPLSNKAVSEIKTRIKNAEDAKSLSLELEGLELEKIPKHVYQNMAHYTSLSFAFNSFSDWPDMFSFSKLQVLNLSGNKITSIAPTIGAITTLKELYLNGNQIKVLPPEIGDLVNLERLNLSNNQIKRIVDDIGCLVKLEELNLMGNPLSTLPESIGCCYSMEVSSSTVSSLN
jgi:Leucine-rich repeat (LRR) protein